MPTKTDRILRNLPGTFRALPRPTALYSIVDGFGNELLRAENSLAAVMLAHWVDFADRGEEFIADLACFAALYGLAPRGVPQNGSLSSKGCPPIPSDEAVEEFRQRLKRYVRTFLEGTTTVQGVLRIVAIALGLEIADAYSDMDTWWTRADGLTPGRGFVTRAFITDEAATTIFGFLAKKASGSAAVPARIEGDIDLSRGVDLRQAHFLRLRLDDQPPVDVDCGAGNKRPRVALLHDIVTAINDQVKANLASSKEGRHLVLSSTKTGVQSRIEVLPHPGGDASSTLFGNAKTVATGNEPAPAEITGTVDLLRPVSLAERQTLLIVVDGGPPARVDVAGVAPDQTFLDEIVGNINIKIPGLASATPDDRLRLTSPQAGPDSTLEIRPLRALELIEYPPTPVDDPALDGPPRFLHHGEPWSVNNYGAADTYLKLELRAPQGESGMEFLNHTADLRVRLALVLNPGEKVSLKPDGSAGLHAEVTAPDGTTHAVQDSRILVGPVGVPFPPNWPNKAAVLTLPRGRSEWTYLDCHEARFDQDVFSDHDHKTRFAGGPCYEVGVFDVSHFAPASPEPDPVFGPLADPPVELRLHWTAYQPGRIVVNLPADLPENFGARFDRARFGRPENSPETYLGVVTEPKDDPDNLKNHINGKSTLVAAGFVDFVPLGWEGMTLPFSHPRTRNLTGGTGNHPAKMYLEESGVPYFIELTARENGAWGNTIEVTARRAGPATFDVTIGYQGAMFENARQVALAGKILAKNEDPLPLLSQEILKPRPVGVLQAKAAGVRADVTRDIAEDPQNQQI